MLGCGKMCFAEWFVRSRAARGIWAYCVMSNLSGGCPCYPYISGEQGYMKESQSAMR